VTNIEAPQFLTMDIILSAKDLPLKDANKEKVGVLFHAGCKYSYDPKLKHCLLVQMP